jgi:hypothetical protein
MTPAEKLTQALRDAGAPIEMIERAMSGYYGDFTSPLALPITQLVVDAEAAGLYEIAMQARRGVYDG